MLSYVFIWTSVDFDVLWALDNRPLAQAEGSADLFLAIFGSFNAIAYLFPSLPPRFDLLRFGVRDR